MRWLFNWWHAMRRAIDLYTLWPIMKEEAPDLDYAKAAFTFHALNDSAWTRLGKSEVMRRIDKLT